MIKIIHKIYNDKEMIFKTEWDFQDEKIAKRELKNVYINLDKTNIIREFSKDYLNYYDTIAKETHIFYIEKEEK